MAESFGTDNRSTAPADGLEAAKLVAPFGLLIAAEGLILLQQIVVGLVLHGVVLLGLFWVIARGDHYRVYEALIFVPLLRLLNLGTGAIRFDPFVWLVGVYGLLLVSVVLVMREYDVGLAELGLDIFDSRRQVGIAAAGVVLGIVLGGVQWLLELEEMPVAPTLPNVIVAALVMGVLVGFVEELLFRGLLQEWLADTVSEWLAVVVVSVLFGFMHSIWFAPANVVFAFMVSLLIGSVYAVTRNFWFIWAVHSIINVMIFAVLPFVLA